MEYVFRGSKNRSEEPSWDVLHRIWAEDDCILELEKGDRIEGHLGTGVFSRQVIGCESRGQVPVRDNLSLPTLTTEWLLVPLAY